jgi:superfamily II DNA or RNA helicase
VDECHRGSANEYGSWRKILDYFDTATQIGMTATPKRTDYVVTNDMAQDNTQAVQEVCGFRWKVEQFHRETKQTVYRLKHELLSDYLRQQLRSPAIQMPFA